MLPDVVTVDTVSQSRPGRTEEEITSPRWPSSDHYKVWVEDGSQLGDAAPEPCAGCGPCFHGAGIPCLSSHHQVLPGRPSMGCSRRYRSFRIGRGKLQGSRIEHRSRYECFPATISTARARRSVRIKGEMTYLPCEPTPPVDLAIDDDPTANPGAQHHHKDIVESLGRSEANFRKRGCVGVVV